MIEKCLSILLILITGTLGLRYHHLNHDYTCHNMYSTHSKQFLTCGTFICPQKLEMASNIRSIQKNDYYLYLLDNGLKFLQITSPSLKVSSNFELIVNVGSIYDPQEYQGMAHLLEHMTFMGSKEYPQEKDLPNFIQNHSGIYNAFTSQTQTRYFFEIEQKQLVSSVTRMVSGIKSPLLRTASLQKQIQAVNQQFELLKDNSAWEDFMILKNVLGDNGYQLFSAGNIESLKKLIQIQQLTNVQSLPMIQFHDKYYSSDIMVAAVMIRQHNQSLINKIISCLSTIKNLNISHEIKQRVLGETPLIKIASEQLIKINNTEPNKHSIDIVIFPFSEQKGSLTIMREDKDNLLKYYEQRILEKGGMIDQIYELYEEQITQISFSLNNAVNSYYPFLDFVFEINPNSREQAKNLSQTLYALVKKGVSQISISQDCLNYIKQKSVKYYQLGKFKQANNLDFIHKLVGNTLYYPFEDLLDRQIVIDKSDRLNTQSQILSWKGIILERSSNCIPKDTSLVYQTDHYLKTVFYKVPLQNINLNGIELKIQDCAGNPYDQFLIKQKGKTINSQQQDKKDRIEWKVNQTGKYSNVMFSRPHSNDPSVRSISMSISLETQTNKLSKDYIILELLMSMIQSNFKIQRQKNLAQSVMSQTSQTLTISERSLIFEATGISLEAVKFYLKEVVQFIFKKKMHNISKNDFDKAYSTLNKKFSLFYTQNRPWIIASTIFNELFVKDLPLVKERMELLNSISYQQFKRNIEVISKGQKVVNWAILAQKWQKEQTIQFVHTIATQCGFQKPETQKNQALYKNTYRCHQQAIKLNIPETQPNNIYSYIPLAQKTPKNSILSKLMAESVQQPFFDHIRTQMKMGYAVASFLKYLDLENEAIGLSCIIVSTDFSVDQLSKQSRKFYKQFFSKNISTDDFDELKDSLRTQFLQPFKSSSQIIVFMKTFIVTNHGKKNALVLKTRMQQIYMQINQLQKVTLEEYLQFKKRLTEQLQKSVTLQFSHLFSQNNEKYYDFKAQNCFGLQFMS